jgi:uncharacterized phage protein gp47/JayE
VLECVRLWDLIGTEMVAASFPGTAWGDYLDLHGETVSLTRDDEVAATGRVEFVGDLGLLIPASTEVSTVQPDPSGGTEPQVFTTDVSVTLAAVPGPVNLVSTSQSPGGTLPSGAYYYVVTAINAGGDETIVSNELLVLLDPANQQLDLDWDDFGGALSYNVYRGRTPGSELLLASGLLTSDYTDDGSAAATGALAPFNAAPVTAADAGSAGNVAAGAISQVLTPLETQPTVTNAAATTGGADVEDDEHFRQRILAAYSQAGGAGNASDYVNWVLANPAVGYVTVQPLWSGAGTVRVIITDRNNQPSSDAVVAEVQADLDPVPGLGAGRAPIGAIVTVATPSTLAIDVEAKVVLASGYSLDGTDGNIAVDTPIKAVLDAYLTTLPPGDDAILAAVFRQIMSVPGVLDVTDAGGTTPPLLNGSDANVSVGALEVATPGVYSLTS